MSYRRAIAAAMLALALGTGCHATGPASYDQTCPTASEDSQLPATCNLDPGQRYDYDRGAWRAVDDSTIYANGNRPPYGATITREAGR